MQNPRDFGKPLAIGAPSPLAEIPLRPSRMIHIMDFSNERMIGKVPELAPTVDILLGNLEDAVPADHKRAAREGLVRVGREFDHGHTQLWTRINSLESPWVLEDLTTLVSEIGDRLEVVMVPKVEGLRDIHHIDRLLAQLEARGGLTRPILVHALLETSLGIVNIEEIAMASPRLQGMSLGPGCETQFRSAFVLGCVGAWSLHPVQIEIAKRVFSPDPDEVLFAKRVLAALPDGHGVQMIDGKMQDDATWKQCQVIVSLAEMLADRDPDLRTAYGF